RTVFVNSMSDLFHDDIPDAYIARVFETMRACPQHTFQVLTKRAERLEVLAPKLLPWPPNVWIGVSVEDGRVIGRIDALLRMPAKIRFLSLEPLIGPLDDLALEQWGGVRKDLTGRSLNGTVYDEMPDRAPVPSPIAA
ncbi:MAG TPA: DUF5131 family protein, partial [Burkholderiales bacterium]|nr:DUF5131 family protein [Burkholderiales bacterium]